MKYLIWRHENALGNSAEQTVGLMQYLHRYPDPEAIVYVEKEFQKHFAMCIPGITPDRIRAISRNLCDTTKIEEILKVDDYSDLVIPSVYHNPSMKNKYYWGSWSNLSSEPSATLEFPMARYRLQNFSPIKLPEKTILIQIREKGTFWKRVDGAESEPARFVDINTYFQVALHYANSGYKVVRIGDRNQTPMPIHPNIMDFAMYTNKNMLDDLCLISTCAVFLSSDSGVWPMAGGMKKNLVMSNVVGNHYTGWLPEETTKVLFKKNGVENTFEELTEAVDYFLNKQA